MFYKGGTVDITVQKQNNDGTLEEILPVTGGPEGGTSVDRAFHLFLESVLGKGILEAFRNTYVEDYLIFIREFEFKKRKSRHSQVQKIRIHIPLQFESLVEEISNITISKALENSQYKGLVIFKKNKLHIERSKFKDFFKEAVDGVIKHINGILSEHVCSDLQDIIMVGGFSESDIIQNALSESFKSYHFRIPANPGLAVLKGAVYFGHIREVLSTVSLIHVNMTFKRRIYKQYKCDLFLTNIFCSYVISWVVLVLLEQLTSPFNIKFLVLKFNEPVTLTGHIDTCICYNDCINGQYS